MSILKGNNSFNTTSSGIEYDTKVSGKNFVIKTNGVSRLTVDDTGVDGVDATKLSGILPVGHGGTGTSSVGSAGNIVLTQGSSFSFRQNWASGSWTPVLNYYNSSGTDVGAETFSAQDGYYTTTWLNATSRRVDFSFYVRVTSYSHSGGFESYPFISGLPFNVSVNSYATVTVSSATSGAVGYTGSYTGELLQSGQYPISADVDGILKLSSGNEIYLCGGNGFILRTGDQYVGSGSYITYD